jgi:hypothetical protein
MRRSLTAICIVLCACGGARDADSPARADSAVVDSTPAATVPDPNLPALSSDSARKFPPQDESAQDTSFTRFRSALLDAIQRKDTTFIYSILVPEIKNGFGGDDSIAGFRRQWRPGSPDTQLWSTLGRLLRLGAVRWGQGFVAPYVFGKWPQDADAFETVAVVNERAIVRANPSDTAQALGTLSYDLVPVKSWTGFGDNGTTGPDTWANITLPGGRTGWIKGLDVYSGVGWRAAFEKRNGQWKMVYFLAGD